MDRIQKVKSILAALDSAPRLTANHLRAAKNAAVAITALMQASDPRHRMILCDVLGSRRERTALEVLFACLEDQYPNVRSAAADALAKIGDLRAGNALLTRLTMPEPDAGTRRMLAAALGAVGHLPAIPVLTEFLTSNDPSLRGCAAWSLGTLGAKAATTAIETALDSETSEYARARMRVALAALAL